MEKINIAELLKDCPKGMELDCTMFDGVVTFNGMSENKYYPINIKALWDGVTYLHRLTKYGQLLNTSCCGCIIFPKGKTTWVGFVPPCKFKDGDIVAFDYETGTQLFIFKEYIHNHDYAQCYMLLDCDGEIYFEAGNFYVDRLATEEEKQKLFDTIKANGYKWNAETKTLENLEVKKFDINTLVPFESKVLVRDKKDDGWSPAIFGCKFKNREYPFFVMNGGYYKKCIPYKGNEHLVGTTDDCDEYYKTWEE